MKRLTGWLKALPWVAAVKAMLKVLLPAAIGTSAAVLTGCYIGKAEFKGEDMRICPFAGADAKCDACADR